MATKKTTRDLTDLSLGRLVQAFTLDLLRPDVRSLQLVNGDTGHTFVITLKSNGAAVPLSTDLHKIIAVFTRADGEVYTQDADSGLSFTEAGVVTIDLRPASFRTGRNTVKLQIYKRENTEATEYPLLLTTYERAFTARLEAIEGEGENAPAQLPMLEQLISDAGDAIDDANDAADAANDAAETVNELLENIDDVPTLNSNNLVKSGGVYSALSEKSAFLGRLATIESAPSVSSYRIGDFFLYVGGDDTLPIYGTSGVPVKQFDVFVCKSCEGSTTNHTPIATPTWTDFTVLTGFNHDLTPSDGYPRMDSVTPAAGTSKKYSRADHVHPSDDSKASVDKTPLIDRLYDATWSTDPNTGVPTFSGTVTNLAALRAAALSSTNRRPIMLWVESNDTPGEYLLLVEHRRIGLPSYMSIELMSAYDGDHTYATAEINVYPSDDTQHTTTITGKWIEI